MRENEIRRENIKQKNPKKPSNTFDDSGYALRSFH